MDTNTSGSHRMYLEKRLRQETAAALDASDARAAAAHVGLATRYLQQLNGAAATSERGSLNEHG